MSQRSHIGLRAVRASLWLVVLWGCASAPPAPPAAPAISFEQKMAWILQLEDQRILRTTLPPPPAPVIPARGKGRVTPPPPPPASSPDLAVLAGDAEPRVRRRAALAVGRVGLPDGVAIVVPLLADADAEVRQMAAFALGSIAVALEEGVPQVHASLAPAIGPLTGALGDGDPLVRGRAAEALGQIGARQAADAVGKMAAEYGRLPVVQSMQPDDETWPGPPEAAAFRLGVFALVRLRAYEPLAAAVLDASGRPLTRWWPAAYALQRLGDRRAAPALTQLLSTPGRYTAAFAARGLGSMKDPKAAAALIPLLDRKQPLEVVVSAVRAVAALGALEAVAPLVQIVQATDVHPNLRLEAVGALGALRSPDAQAVIQDLVSDQRPAMRAAALRAAAAMDREAFLLLLSGLDPDPQWRVRAALADALGSLSADVAATRLREMLSDDDKRVIPSVLGALARIRAPGLTAVLLERLKDPDSAVREAALRYIGELKPAEGLAALREAYKAARGDAAYATRVAAIGALAEYGAPAADLLKDALEDRDWAVRLRAAALLSRIDPQTDYKQMIRPAPGHPVATYVDPLLLSPQTSPHAFIDTARGTIEIELAVLDAPQTTRNFIALATKGFFNGLAFHRVIPNFVVQDGDPRGDGGGGPGYTIRDELNMRPYVRGTIGMALSRRDDAGSQYFITHSPQPHLDGRYTVFGHVVSGMEIVDQIQQGDIVDRVRIWDGKTMK